MSGGAVFLLTDYGDDDEFAGLTRAVIRRLAPAAPVVDLTHGIPPFDVRAGAHALTRCVGFLGPGVVVAVVDPGVGSDRRAVAVEVGGAVGVEVGVGVGVGVEVDPGPGNAATGPRYLVGPDNGLLVGAVDLLGGPVGVVSLTAPGLPSRAGRAGAGATFDGRDLFAPVAARLWAGAG
ncbi:MAG: SAM-dependent chlorinase/fluorinase, partial [Acidimicrobiales bacterium]